MTNLNLIKETLQERKRVVITTHFKPDGDALGSSLAMYHWLKKRGHEVAVIVPSDFPYFLDWMPGRELVQIFTDNRDEFGAAIAQAEVIFCLDFNGLARLHEMGEMVGASSALKFMIDHHLEPTAFEQASYWDPNAAATAQLVYRFLSDFMQANLEIDADMATCLYTGIMTDTGSFRFQSTTAEVHRIVADLIEKGAKNWAIHEHIYNSYTPNRLQFLGFALMERLKVLPEYHTAYFTLSKEDLQRFSIGTGDTEGLVNYALAITGIKLAALIIERSEAIKLSFRSVGEFPCNELSKTHFNGGGHRNAAGGNSSESLEATVQRFLDVLPLYKNKLHIS